MFLALIVVVLVQASSGGAEPTHGFARRMLIGFKDGAGGTGPAQRVAVIHQLEGEIHHVFRLLPLVSAWLPEGAIARLRSRADIAYVEEDVILHALSDQVPWGVDKIDAEKVWPTGNRGSGSHVAILDTGIDYDHPDLAANIAGGVYFAGGFLDEFFGRDGSTSPSAWNDNNGHGTHCAGIVAALQNGTGVVGVAPQATLHAVQVLDDRGSGYTSDICQGLEWCADHGIDVASMSFGGDHTTALRGACQAAQSAGVILVAASGNGYGAAVLYPAAYDSVIAVSATDSGDNLASFSNIGPQIELAAPGVSIKSTYAGGGYATMGGTSMACPHVAGAVALALAGGVSNPRSRLQDTAVDLGVPGRDTRFGYGRVDAAKATGTADEAPVARFVGSPTSGTAPLTVSFTDQSTGTVTSWSWTFGDGGSSSLRNPSHRYTSAGTYTVRLTVSGPKGSDTETLDGYITVGTVQAPVAQFAGSPTSGDAPLTVSFTDQSTGTINNWSWNFGDGGTSTQASPSHQYTSAGTYTVSLTVSGPGGSDTESKTGYVIVTAPAPPNAAFVGSPTRGDAPLTVSFTDQSTGAVTSWSWTFGDGATSTQQHPSHTYSAPGTYDVSLTVTGPGGSDTATASGYVLVEAPSVATMHVADITLVPEVMSWGSWGSWCRSSATVRIADRAGAPVANASVYGTWSGAAWGNVSAWTNANGVATFYATRWVRGGGTFTFTVTNVTRTGWLYDAAANVETSDSITLP
jgi:subtilisin